MPPSAILAIASIFPQTRPHPTRGFRRAFGHETVSSPDHGPNLRRAKLWGWTHRQSKRFPRWPVCDKARFPRDTGDRTHQSKPSQQADLASSLLTGVRHRLRRNWSLKSCRTSYSFCRSLLSGCRRWDQARKSQIRGGHGHRHLYFDGYSSTSAGVSSMRPPLSKEARRRAIPQ